MKKRVALASLSLSAAALVGIVMHEGYREDAYIPVPGDRPTIGFGTTDGVQLGDRTSPTEALRRALIDVDRFTGALKDCVQVPLTQYELDAYVSLSYNIGSQAFCASTLVRKLNREDYEGACREILRWDWFNGRRLPGLTKRRQSEYAQCLGEGQ
jgi:lysozyme